MNRGIEISSELADGARSLILDQVTNGVAVRMAVLYLLAGGSHAATEDVALAPDNSEASKEGKRNGRKKGN
jgi:hypothetical protein